MGQDSNATKASLSHRNLGLSCDRRLRTTYKKCFARTSLKVDFFWGGGSKVKSKVQDIPLSVPKRQGGNSTSSWDHYPPFNAETSTHPLQPQPLRAPHPHSPACARPASLRPWQCKKRSGGRSTFSPAESCPRSRSQKKRSPGDSAHGRLRSSLDCKASCSRGLLQKKEKDRAEQNKFRTE